MSCVQQAEDRILLHFQGMRYEILRQRLYLYFRVCCSVEVLRLCRVTLFQYLLNWPAPSASGGSVLESHTEQHVPQPQFVIVPQHPHLMGMQALAVDK
jgi:hypothetical protein